MCKYDNQGRQHEEKIRCMWKAREKYFFIAQSHSFLSSTNIRQDLMASLNSFIHLSIHLFSVHYMMDAVGGTRDIVV